MKSKKEEKIKKYVNPVGKKLKKTGELPLVHLFKPKYTNKVKISKNSHKKIKKKTNQENTDQKYKDTLSLKEKTQKEDLFETKKKGLTKDPQSLKTKILEQKGAQKEKKSKEPPKQEETQKNRRTEKKEKPSPPIIQKKKKTENIKNQRVLLTPFDTIMELVEKEKQIPLSKIAERFNINKKVAQEWGEILSENKLIDFHIPAFGEPELRKKDYIIQDNKIKKKIKKRVIIITAGIVLIIFLIGFIILQKDSERIAPKTIQTKGEIQKEEQKISEDLIKRAFSGNGTYECRNENGTIKYMIKDMLLKVEKVDGSSKIIIKNNKTHTLNIKTKEWIESEMREGIPLPGSNIYPKTKLKCKEANITESEFKT